MAAQPAARATLTIPVIRHEAEELGAKYGSHLIERIHAVPPANISGAMKEPTDDAMLHIRALHLADDRPYAIEDRWINTTVVPRASTEAFDTLSANEWLMTHAPYTHGDIGFSAVRATPKDAEILGVPSYSAVFSIDWLTWDDTVSVTKVRLLFTPGYQLRTVL